MDAILQTAFSNACHWIETFDFQVKLHWNMFLGSNCQKYSIGFDNGLVPNRQQAIIWSNEDLISWCIYVSLEHSELKD